jgi:hypothetical protein
MWEQTYKPGSVPLSRAAAVISLERALPRASSSRPGDSAGSLISPYVALHRAGFTQVAGRPALRALLPHDFTLTGLSHPRKRKFRRYVSVALSFGLPRLGVTQRPALWCPDFPPEASLSLGLRRSPGLLPEVSYYEPAFRSICTARFDKNRLLSRQKALQAARRLSVPPKTIA